jgi:autotransporter-associated beta strand protein
VLLLATLLAGTCLMPLGAAGQTPEWISTGTGVYANSANWSPATAPVTTDTALFSTSGSIRSLTVSGAVSTSVAAWQFASGAPAYTFSMQNTFDLRGSGIVNSSSNKPTLNVTGTGSVTFSNSSSAANATISNIIAGSATTFRNTSTASTATISNTNSGTLSFQDSATAGSATITNTSTLNFTQSATAGSATINNNGAAGLMTFSNSSTAGSATITTGSSGRTRFSGSSTGGEARLIANSGGTVDISGLTGSGMTAGSIEGAGTYQLGSKQLTVGSNNRSGQVTGTIADGGNSGGTGGSLVKTGSGTMILTGTNTYTGGTTISGGTLQLGNGTATGSIAGNVVNDGTLAFARNNTTTFSGVISGSGAVQQTSGALLILTGANTYTGGTTVSGGALQIGAAGAAGSIVGNVTNNATFQIVNADTSGLTSITTNNVTVLFASSSAGTAVLTTNSGGFVGFRADSTGGQAQLVTNAGGTVDLSGRTSSSMTAGSISGAGNYNLGAAQLTVGSNNLSTTVSGVIADGGLMGGTGGSLVKTGTGTLTLTGANTFTGGTTVSQGLLVVNGSLASGVTLSGGTLGGSGSIGGLTTGGGILAPGNSIGTLTVNGNLVLNGGTYQVEANAAGQSDLISATGSATINGGTVQVVAQSGTYARNTTYTILNAAGGVSGVFSSVSSNFAFLTPSLSYDANNVYLLLFQNQSAFAAGAQTANQFAVGAVLDQVNATATGDLNTVLNALSVLSTTQGPAALDAISGQPYANFGTMNVQSGVLFMNAVGQQMAVARRGAASGGQRQALAQACEIEACDGSSPWGAWASAIGGLGNVAGNASSATLTYNFGGGAAGVDYRLDPRFLVGLGTAYAAGNQWVDGFMGRGWTDSISVMGYGSFTQAGFYTDALAGYAYSGNQQQRQIIISGLQPRTANGSTGANQFLGQVESGYKLAVYTPAMATLTPFGRLQVSSVTQNAFSEWGASSLSLNVAQQTTNSVRSTLGADLAGSIGLGDTRTLDLALRLGWLHEYADTGRPITGAFAGAPANAFTVYGATPQRDSAVIGFSASTIVAEATQLYLRYDGEISSGSGNHTLNAGVRFTW